MALAFSTTKIEPSTEGFDKLALLEATENLNQAWMDLTEAQRGMDEVCAIMENIHTSVDLINKFGKDAIPMLNVDGGLEALLQIPENVITAEKAMEGFGEAAKSAWEKIKAFIMRIFNALKEFFFGHAAKAAKEAATVKTAADEVADKTFVGTEDLDAFDGKTFESTKTTLEIWGATFIPAINEAAKFPNTLMTMLKNKDTTVDRVHDTVMAEIKRVNASLRKFNVEFGVDAHSNKVVIIDSITHEDATLDYASRMLKWSKITYEAAGWNKENWIELSNILSESLNKVSSSYKYYSDECKKFENELIRTADALSDSEVKTVAADDQTGESVPDKKETIKTSIVFIISYVNGIHRLESWMRGKLEDALASVKKNCLS